VVRIARESERLGRLRSYGERNAGTHKLQEVGVAKSEERVVEEFGEAVNMGRRELQDWLKTDEFRQVGQKVGGGESKGHESGRRIVEILGKKRSDYND
jgi:Protein of unknown function (DUF3140)